MKINKFEVITGTCIEEIPGQWRLGYSLSDTSDFYDVACWAMSVIVRHQSIDIMKS